MKSLRDFKDNDSGVSYLIVYIIIAMLVFGGVYALMNDVKDEVEPIFGIIGAYGGEYHDEDTIWGWDFINALFSFSIAFFVLAIVHYAFVMSQKPEIPY